MEGLVLEYEDNERRRFVVKWIEGESNLGINDEKQRLGAEEAVNADEHGTG